MAQYDFDNLAWDAGTDGATVMDWPRGLIDDPASDAESLLGAWLAERGKSVEAELLLARARSVLSRLVHATAAPLSPTIRRELRHLIAEINGQLS